MYNKSFRQRARTDGMINLINYIIETLLLNWIYFCVSAGIAMFLASVAETVYSYLQVSFRLVQRWVMPDIIAKIKKVVEKTLTPNPWTTHMQGRSSHICTYMHIRLCIHVHLKFWKNTRIIYVLFCEKAFFIIKLGWLIHFLHYTVFWCPCVSISFILLFRFHNSVESLAFFSQEHCTLPTTLEMSKIYNYLLHFLHINLLKCLVENAESGISETLNLRTFQQRKISRYAPDMDYPKMDYAAEV